MIVPDEIVVEALLRDARRFKSKWELNVNEPERAKPNTRFLKRTLSNVVKMNNDRMRKPRNAQSYEREIRAPSPNRDRCPRSPASSKSKRDLKSKPEKDSKRHKKSRNCSKSKHRSPSTRHRSKEKHEGSKHKSKKFKSV